MDQQQISPVPQCPTCGTPADYFHSHIVYFEFGSTLIAREYSNCWLCTECLDVIRSDSCNEREC